MDASRLVDIVELVCRFRFSAKTIGRESSYGVFGVESLEKSAYKGKKCREIQGNGDIWKENASPTVAACGSLCRASPAPITNSLQSRSWEPMSLEASARRLQGFLAPGPPGLLLRTKRLVPTI